MQGLVDRISGGGKSKGSKRDDDWIDRLSSRYTVVLLVVFAVLIGITAYVGKAMTCWAPKHFTKSYIMYMNSYCWVRNTYYLPWEQVDIPGEEEPRSHLKYYQWMPFILLGQAVLFFLPSTVWHGLNQKGGIDSDNILAAACTFTRAKFITQRESKLAAIVNLFDRFLSKNTNYAGGYNCKSVCSIRLGSYLIILFLVSKVLYIANVIGQLFVLNSILSAEYNLYGFDVMGGMLESDHNWDKSASVVFPRVTMCDFRVRRLGNVHRYTVQCVLPINLYTEKIYVFLWFWMVFVAAMSVIGFITWFARMIMTGDKRSYALNHLRASAMKREFDNSKLDQFINEYLRQDGMFLLRLIGHNTNNITVTEIMGALWDRFITHEEDKANKLDAPYNPVEDSLPLLPDKGADPLPAKAPPLEGPLAS